MSKRVLDWREENSDKRHDRSREKFVKDLVIGQARKVLARNEAKQLLDDENIELSPDLRERVEDELQRTGRGSVLRPEEKAIIVELHHQGVGRRRIADCLRRDHTTVRKFLDRYTSRTKLSRMYFEAKADVLARRVVREANVNESLEVLDRIDVLPKKNRGGDQGGTTFNVVVGVPGQAAPAPPQKVIDSSATRDE